MSELSPGSQVYIFQYQMDELKVKTTATSKANYLINCFYKKYEQLGMNLTGANGKIPMDKTICNAIIGK